MNFEEYDNHISQKLKLAVAVAIIRSVPDNLSTFEYINQLKSNILQAKDPELECSVCSDDFNHSDHNLTFNNNIRDIDNESDSKNPSLSNNCNKNVISNIDNDNKSHCNNNGYDNPINSSKNDDNNTDMAMNCVIDNDIDNTALIKDAQAVNVTTNEEYDTHFNRHVRKSGDVEIEVADNDILYNDDGISLMDTDYEDLIDEVLQLHESPTILNDFCVNDFGNTDRVTNNNNNKDANIVYRQEMLSQAVLNTIQTVDVTQNLKCNDDETYYDSNKDTTTVETANIYEKIPQFNKKANDDDSLKLVDSNKKNSNLKHDLNIDHDCSPKRRKNTHTDLKLPLDNPISDPYSRIKTNICKYLENNNNIANKPRFNEIAHVKETVGLETVSKKTDQFNTECTQYSESQPLLVIDQKYIYEKSKSISRIGIDQIISTELTTTGINISTNDTNVNNIDDLQHDVTYINPNTQETVPDIQNFKTNTTKIIENDTEFHFEREIFHSSEEIGKARTDNTKLRIEYTNTKMNPTIIIENNQNSRSKEIQTTAVLETYSRDLPINNMNTMQYPADSFSQQNNNNRNINNNYNKTTTIDLTENNLPIENAIEINMNTMQCPADSFSQENNNNRNINNNSNPTTHSIDLTEINLPIENSIKNNMNSMQYPADSFSEENNNNRIINNNSNKTTTQSIDLTESDLPIENSNENEEEIANQNSKSDSDLTDSDEDRTEGLIPFKVIEELNKIKVYLNRKDRFCESSSDTGYKSDSVSRNSLKMSQSNTWLNQSARSLFLYITSCPLISTTKEMTREISVVLSELIQKLHDDDTYMSFMEDVLETTNSLLHSVLDANFDEHQMIIQDGTTQRILLLNKCIHIQKYTIQKITHILETIHTNLYETETYEAVDIQKIENLCHIFHILQIILQRYYKNQENLKKKQENSQKSQLESQKSQYFSQKNQFDCQYSPFTSQLENHKGQIDSQKSQFSSQSNQKSQIDSQFSSQKSQFSSQNSQFSSQNSQVTLRKTDISDIWRKKWNPNFREEKNDENLDRKCALTDCSNVLNKLIVSCMDGYKLIAYSALKCFNLMQSN